MTTAMAAPELAAPGAASTFERLYFEHYLDEARAMARARRPVALLTETTGGDLGRSPRWRELLRSAGLGDELRGAFTAAAGLWSTAELAREAGRSFTAGEVALVRRLAPHVGAGLRVASLRARAEGQDAAPLAVRMLAGTLRRTLRPETDGDADRLPRLRVRGRSGRWLTLHGSLTEPAPDRPAEVAVVVEPARAEELVELGPAAYGLSPGSSRS
jgi:hypothetical protein